MGPNYRCQSKVFKVTNNVELTLDIHDVEGHVPEVALIHFHGGFLVVGEKTTFPPHWLINACLRRKWAYVTPSYRLLPEASGTDVLDDALAAVDWVTQNLTSKIILAGSSAGGFLALLATSQRHTQLPLAVLSIYGLTDFASHRYIQPGVPLTQPLSAEDLASTIDQIKKASVGASAITGYPFPEDENDIRLRWISALHQEAYFPELLCREPGLAARIRETGIEGIPDKIRKYFPVHFGFTSHFPPTAFLHGKEDTFVGYDQSTLAAEKLRSLGVSTCFQLVEGKDHGFDCEFPHDVDIEQGVQEDTISQRHLCNILAFFDQAVKSAK